MLVHFPTKVVLPPAILEARLTTGVVMFELLELCVKLAILCVVLSIWFVGLLTLITIGVVEDICSRGRSTEAFDLIRPWNGLCDSSLRML